MYLIGVVASLIGGGSYDAGLVFSVSLSGTGYSFLYSPTNHSPTDQLGSPRR